MKAKYIGYFIVTALVLYGAATLIGIIVFGTDTVSMYWSPWFWCIKYTSFAIVYIAACIMTILPYKGKKRKEETVSLTPFVCIALHITTAAIAWWLCIEKDFEGLIVIPIFIIGILLPIGETINIYVTECEEKIESFQYRVDTEIKEKEEKKRLESNKKQAIREVQKIKPLYDRRDFFDDGDN